MDRQIIETPTGYRVIEETPQWKVATALDLVKQALNNEVGFCYRRVKRYPLATGTAVRNEMEQLKKQRNSPATNVHLAGHITDRLAELREVEKSHYTYDKKAYGQLQSGYHRIKRSLDLLIEEGEVECYTLTPSGRLSVEFWTEHETTYTKTIEQGWTFQHKRDEMFDTSATVEESVPVIADPTVNDILGRNKELIDGGEFPPMFDGTTKVKELLPGTIKAKKAEDHGNNGAWHVSDDVGRVIKRYADRGPDLGKYLTEPLVGLPVEQRIALPPVASDGTIYSPVDSPVVDQEQWRKDRMNNYIKVMYACYLYWKSVKHLGLGKEVDTYA